MRSFYILIVCLVLMVSGCGKEDSAVKADSYEYTDSTATYSGSKVIVTTDRTGKASVNSSTLGLEYNIYTVNSSGDPVTGIAVVYSEDKGKSVIKIKYGSRVYSDVILIGTPMDLSSVYENNNCAFGC